MDGLLLELTRKWANLCVIIAFKMPRKAPTSQTWLRGHDKCPSEELQFLCHSGGAFISSRTDVAAWFDFYQLEQ